RRKNLRPPASAMPSEETTASGGVWSSGSLGSGGRKEQPGKFRPNDLPNSVEATPRHARGRGQPGSPKRRIPSTSPSVRGRRFHTVRFLGKFVVSTRQSFSHMLRLSSRRLSPAHGQGEHGAARAGLSDQLETGELHQEREGGLGVLIRLLDVEPVP